MNLKICIYKKLFQVCLRIKISHRNISRMMVYNLCLLFPTCQVILVFTDHSFPTSFHGLFFFTITSGSSTCYFMVFKALSIPIYLFSDSNELLFGISTPSVIVAQTIHLTVFATGVLALLQIAHTP